MPEQKAVNQPLCVGPLVEKALGSGQFNGMRFVRSRVNRESEDLNERKFGAYAARRLDAIHFRHRDIHQDNIRPECVRLSDRVDPIGGFAHDLKLGPLFQ